MRVPFKNMPTAMPLACALALASLTLSACDGGETAASAETEGQAAADYERGPHNGRMLRDRDFAVEMTIFEDGVPPEFHVYAYQGNKPLPPEQIQLSVVLKRLDREENRFSFAAVEDYLRGSGTVTEPHSFDVTVIASHAGQRHSWKYASYEGRTTIAAQAAQQAGIKIEQAGPAVIDQTIDLVGRIELAPASQAEVGARFPGRVMSVHKQVGDRVAAGTLLARVESNESLQTYSVFAPRGGIILERRTNVGDVTGSDPIFIIADPAEVMAVFPIYPRDIERVRPGQAMTVQSLAGERRHQGVIRDFLPLAQATSQTVSARVPLANPDGFWRAGMSVRGKVTVAQREVPLAVKTSGLQAFRDFTVVFAKVGNSYEVRMLELGQQTPEWTEVLGGIKPGQPYVADGSYVIKADIEKSGASHDH